MQSIDEFFCCDPCLLEHAGQSADFQFAMIGYDAAAGATAEDDMTATLPGDGKAHALKSTHHLRSGDVRQARHAPQARKL